MEIVMHTCNTCGQEKEIYVQPEENIENLEGCVCDRTVKSKHHDIKILS